MSLSTDGGVNWNPYPACSGANNTAAACALQAAMGATSFDHVELPVSLASTAQGAGTGYWMEIDNFTVTVN